MGGQQGGGGMGGQQGGGGMGGGGMGGGGMGGGGMGGGGTGGGGTGGGSMTAAGIVIDANGVLHVLARDVGDHATRLRVVAREEGQPAGVAAQVDVARLNVLQIGEQ